MVDAVVCVQKFNFFSIRENNEKLCGIEYWFTPFVCNDIELKLFLSTGKADDERALV